jgi:hypothetical protein
VQPIPADAEATTAKRAPCAHALPRDVHEAAAALLTAAKPFNPHASLGSLLRRAFLNIRNIRGAPGATKSAPPGRRMLATTSPACSTSSRMGRTPSVASSIDAESAPPPSPLGGGDRRHQFEAGGARRKDDGRRDIPSFGGLRGKFVLLKVGRGRREAS